MAASLLLCSDSSKRCCNVKMPKSYLYTPTCNTFTQAYNDTKASYLKRSKAHRREDEHGKNIESGTIANSVYYTAIRKRR